MEASQPIGQDGGMRYKGCTGSPNDRFHLSTGGHAPELEGAALEGELVRLMPAGDCYSQQVGIRILSAGTISGGSYGRSAILFHVAGMEPDYVGRRGGLISSGLLGNDPETLVEQVRSCRSFDDLAGCFPNLIYAAPHMRGVGWAARQQDILPVIRRFERSRQSKVGIRSLQSCYLTAEALVMAAFGATGCQGVSYSCSNDQDFDLCVFTPRPCDYIHYWLHPSGLARVR
jgi:hypothetical protein